MSSVVDGLTKRNGTRFVEKIFSTAISDDSFIHFINRSKSERYVLIHDGTNLRGFNVLTGQEVTLKVDGTEYTSGYPISGTYLDTLDSSTTPRERLRATTVADGTFLLNRDTIVSIDESNTSPALEREALIFVKQGDYEKEYALDITYNTETPSPAQLQVTYKKVRSVLYSDVYELEVGDSTTVISSGGGYIDGKAYKSVASLPSTYNGAPLRVTDELKPSFTLTTDSEVTNGTGVVSAGVVASIGSAFSIDRRQLLNPPDTISFTLTLEEPEGIELDSYKQVVSVKAFSESDSDSYHTDTKRICNIIVAGDENTLIDGPNYTKGHAPSPTGLEDVLPGIVAGTNSEFSLERDGNLIVLTRTGDSDFRIKSSDGLSGQGVGVVYKEVGAITDLPVYAKNGFRVKVRGDAESNADDYYVKFETDDPEETIGNGKWVETVAPSAVLGLDADTVPLVLTSDRPNYFTVKPLNIADRLCGDNVSNPFPSFVGSGIENSVFFKNRLGFIGTNNVILSEAGLGFRGEDGVFQYNFGRTTVTTLLDSEPIDVTVESNRVTRLSAAAAVQENLILFADNGQFVLKGEELLTPRTVSVKPITNFEYNKDTDPVSVGSYIYYPFDFGSHTGIREFSLNKDTDVYESNAITEQVPRYIPKDITYFAGSLTENLLAVLSKEDDKILYMYRYFYSEGRKVLSSWFKWDFGVHIKGFYFMDSVMYLIATNDEAGETYILNMPLNFDGEDEGKATYVIQDSAGAVTTTITESDDDHVTYLDMRIPGMVYGNRVKFPTFTSGATRPLRESISSFGIGAVSQPAPFSVPTDYSVYTDRGLLVNATSDSNGVITLESPGLPDSTAVWVGFKYDSKYVFSEQIFKGQAGQARTPNAAAKQFIKNLSLYHTETSDYQVKVTPDKRDQYINTYPETTTGTGSSQDIELKDGFFRAPVFTSSEGVEISLENNGAMPSNFQSAEFETFIHTRSRRYGA
jgi:hypothetical protein